jgi:pimeloyl-ACP methyl ester carboxylesterase
VNTSQERPRRYRTTRRFPCGAHVAGIGALLACVAVVPVASEAAAATARSGSTTATADSTQGRGSVVSVQRIDRSTLESVRTQLAREVLPTDTARYGVDVYKVVYRTVDGLGRPTTASGLVQVPQGASRTQQVVVYEHGTTVEKAGAPSGNHADDNRTFPLFFAAAGYFTVAPDYLGLGDGPGLHPYDHAATEATASLDLMRAARNVAGCERVRLEERVLVTGFSQGGHAAMALARSLQSGADPTFRLGGLAPVAGPYDLADVMLPAALTYQGAASNFSLAYLLLGWNPIYDLYDRPQDVFRADQVDKVVRLFDGTHDYDYIVERLPATVDELLRPAFAEQLRHPTGRLAQALRENGATCDWKPQVPVRLFGGGADTTVPFANTHNCARRLTDHGARVRVVDVGPVEHFESRILATSQVLAWFGRQH